MSENVITPYSTEDRHHELLRVVIAALDEVIPKFGYEEPWKHACVSIRKSMFESLTSPLEEWEKSCRDRAVELALVDNAGSARS
jgi:hypothetical protein